MKKLYILLILSLIFNNLTYGQVGINTENPQGLFHVDGKSTSATTNATTGVPTLEQQSDDFIVMPNGSVGIGAIPTSSAILELNVNQLQPGNKKGFLAPQVALTSSLDVATIKSPATGLLVYNLGTEPTFDYNGYVFWNGVEWKTLGGNSLINGTISSINCTDVTLSPKSYIAGTTYNGTLTIPYTGGNGGIYTSKSIGPINGLTATLNSGNFEKGSGVLNYTVTGIPTISSPETTTFPISIAGQTCDAIVGIGDDVKLGELVYYKADNIPANIGAGGANGTINSNWLNSNVSADNSLPILGGKLRLDGYFTANANAGTGTVSFNPRLVNVSQQPVKFWFAALTNVDRFNGANIVLSAAGSGSSAPGGGGWVNLDNGIYSNFGSNGTINNPQNEITNTGVNNQEVLTMDINLDDKWYRVYYFMNVDNNNTTSTSDDIRRLYLSIQRLY